MTSTVVEATLYLAAAVVTGAVAWGKHRHFWRWFAFSAIFPVMALVAVLFARDRG